ncbi:MAG: hypothetical protein BWK80_42790 [Desulfobacteraceae bacterium IS3]|nr:MAG: hypothetical protein BWK80_42790 [Desulfobacteraceae bacterium IS3]
MSRSHLSELFLRNVRLLRHNMPEKQVIYSFSVVWYVREFPAHLPKNSFLRITYKYKINHGYCMTGFNLKKGC